MANKYTPPSRKSGKTYQKVKHQLNRAVVKVSMALHEGRIDEEKAKALLLEDIKRIHRNKGLKYLVDAYPPALFEWDKRRTLPNPNGELAILLFYEPVVEYMKDYY